MYKITMAPVETKNKFQMSNDIKELFGKKLTAEERQALREDQKTYIKNYDDKIYLTENGFVVLMDTEFAVPIYEQMAAEHGGYTVC